MSLDIEQRFGQTEDLRPDLLGTMGGFAAVQEVVVVPPMVQELAARVHDDEVLAAYSGVSVMAFADMSFPRPSRR